jgi:hypothetical protein
MSWFSSRCWAIFLALVVQPAITTLYSQQTIPARDAVLEPNSNRVVWRSGANGTSSFERAGLEYKILVYGGKVVRTRIQLWGDYLLGYVQVINQEDSAVTIDTRRDVSVRLSDPQSSQDVLFPRETEAFARELLKGSRKNKQLAQQIQSTPSALGPVTINAKGVWEGLFYFTFRNKIDSRFIHAADFQVEVGGVAFVFPSQL